MRLPLLTFVALLAVGSHLSAACLGKSEPSPDASIAHLPREIQHDIMAWRDRLESAACIKVVIEIEETWEDMSELDDSGSPRVIRHERYQSHSWMTPEMSWLVVFAYDGDKVDTDTPRTQILWYKDTGVVRERYWAPEAQAYRVRQYEEPDPYGPGNVTVADTKGCLVATGLNSWLVGGPTLADRKWAHSVALMRNPNLAVIPLETPHGGVWLDVIGDEIERDRYPDKADRLYRRNDMMLLSRDETGEPVVSEWRTIVMTDREDGCLSPTQITGVTRLSYQFFNAVPSELIESTSAFAEDMDDVTLLLSQLKNTPESTED